MYFKDLNQNAAVYILDKQTMTLAQGKVISRGFPRMDMTSSGKTGMVVDITIEANGKNANYVIPENCAITFAGDIVLSVDRQGLASEVEAMKASAEQVLSSVDKQKQILDKATGLLEELNPVFKERQETEKRFKSLENSMSEIKDMFSQLMRRDGSSRDSRA